MRNFTRKGYDFTARFPKITEAVASLSVRSCVIDDETVVVDERGLSVFDALRYRLSSLLKNPRHGESVVIQFSVTNRRRLACGAHL